MLSVEKIQGQLHLLAHIFLLLETMHVLVYIFKNITIWLNYYLRIYQFLHTRLEFVPDHLEQSL